MKKVILKKKNIYLKTLEESDYSKKYYNWLNDKEINKYLETRFKKNSKKDIINFIKSNTSSSDTYLFGIFVNKLSNLDHIGNIKIGPINLNHKYAYVSYFIGEKEYWGKGYATEACYGLLNYVKKNTAFKNLKAYVYKENIASSKCEL